MAIEISIEADDWRAIEFEALAMRAIEAALSERGLSPEACDVSVLACRDAHIAELNAQYRAKAVATNVLSWPAVDLAAAEEGGEPEPPRADFMGETTLGDIAIAYETCAREAEAAGKPMADHVTHLVVHGLLHLLGYDHVRDGDAARMEALEAKILGTLGLDDPYKEATGP